jgi:hypothetical protein
MPCPFSPLIAPVKFEQIVRRFRLRACNSPPHWLGANLAAEMQRNSTGGVMKYLLILAALVGFTAATPVVPSNDNCCGGGSCCLLGGCCMEMTE